MIGLFVDHERRRRMRRHLLASSVLDQFIGTPARFDVSTINRIAPEPDPRELLGRMVEAIELMKLGPMQTPSVIVVADELEDGVTVRAGEICFLTLSTAGLERISSRRADDDPFGFHREDATLQTLAGIPIVKLFDLMTSDNPNARKLAQYYAAAVVGARKAREG